MGDKFDNADPYLDAGVRGWLVNTVRQHYWKVASWFEFDDLLQEGYLAFAKCRAKFEPMHKEVEAHPEDRKRFMAYFQMAFNNRIIDLQQHPRSKLQEMSYASLSDNQTEGIESWTESAAELSDANLASLLAQAPTEITEMLKQILVDGVANTPYLNTRLRKKFLPNCAIPRIVKCKHRVRETTEEHYDRCLGKKGVVSQLRQYFLGETEEPLIDKLVEALFAKEENPSSMVELNVSVIPQPENNNV
jgi:DNA-directed RNA polymerase specialized sigma24 family protein